MSTSVNLHNLTSNIFNGIDGIEPVGVDQGVKEESRKARIAKLKIPFDLHTESLNNNHSELRNAHSLSQRILLLLHFHLRTKGHSAAFQQILEVAKIIKDCGIGSAVIMENSLSCHDYKRGDSYRAGEALKLTL